MNLTSPEKALPIRACMHAVAEMLLNYNNLFLVYKVRLALHTVRACVLQGET